MPAQPGEVQLIPALRGIVLVADAEEARRGVGGGSGFDASRVTLKGLEDLKQLTGYFIGQPASLPSLERIVTGIQTYLQATGRKFVLVYLPAQDLSDGSVRIVVQQARISGAIGVAGATHFAPGQYEGVFGMEAGQPIDDGRIEETLERLNRNPFRRATVVAEPGAEAGTTRLALRLTEQPPWSAQAGAENNGTRNTGRHRVFAGFSWGDAFGRGDQVSYQFKADPDHLRLVSHSLSYVADVGRGTASVNGAYSRLRPDLGPFFGQEGRSYQVSGRYSWPAPAPTGWSAQWSMGPDFKSSDNTIEFASTPVVNNTTHIYQLAGTYALRAGDAAAASELSLTGIFSPGGADRYNDDSSFGSSRAGASARYGYGRIDALHRRVLGAGWSVRLAGSVQWASGPLLGTEQLAGGGTAAIRALSENAAFGDSGIILTSELHAPVWQPAPGHAFDAYLFIDAARLVQRGGAPDSSPVGAGIGLDYSFSQRMSVRSSYGRVLNRVPGSADSRDRVNFLARMSF